jgi:hypothetical protein
VQIREVERDTAFGGIRVLVSGRPLPDLLRIFLGHWHVLVIRVTFERNIDSNDRQVVANRLEGYEDSPFFFGHWCVGR